MKEPGEGGRWWSAPWLWAGALAFEAVARARGAAYDAGALRSVSVSRPVISVGNLAVGGRGKTPLTILLAQRLLARGVRVVVLSRGYGREVRGDAPVLVSRGQGPLVDARLGGDEPVLIAERTQAGVVVCADRARGARLAIESLGAQVLILDDGFQHRRLARDLDIVVLDGQRPLANRRLLPAGPLREPPSALQRAHLVVLNRGDSMEPAQRPPELSDRHAVVEVAVVPTCVVSSYESGDVSEPPERLDGARVALLSAIARPERFVRTVERLGATVVHKEHFADHHGFTQKQVRAFKERAKSAGAACLLTTEKDAVRLPQALRAGLQVVRIEHRVVEGEAALEAALASVIVRVSEE